MTEAIDEYTALHLDRFDGKYKLVSVAREGINIDDEEEKKEEEQQDFAPVLSYLKKTLGGKVIYYLIK